MSNRILDLLREGRLARGTYAGTDAQGRQTLCLLTALTGDPSTRPTTCPATVAPTWIAHLAPWWDDAGTAERWRDLMQQIGELSPRFGELTGATNRRALAGCQLVTLRVALRHAGEARPVVDRVITLWERVLRGDEPTADEWATARAAAAAADSADATEAAEAAAAATWAADAARAATAAEAAARAAAAKAKAAAAKAKAAAAAEAKAAAAAEAAAAWAADAAADDIIQGHINAIREALSQSKSSGGTKLTCAGDYSSRSRDE